MKAPALLALLRNRGVQVWADGDRLRCESPAGTLTPELRDELRQCKQDILAFLRSAGSLARQPRAVVPLQPGGTRTPVYAVAGHNGDVFCYRALVQHLGEDQPFFGLQPPGLNGDSQPLARVEDLAAYFAGQIRASQPTGPYVIAGYCAGGAIAFELARQMLLDGAAISALVLFGAPYPTTYRLLPQTRQRLAVQIARVAENGRALAALPPSEWRPHLARKLRNRQAQRAVEQSAVPDPVLAQRKKVGRFTVAALRRYQPGRFAGSLVLLLPSKAWVLAGNKALRWRSTAEHVEEYYGPDGCHTDIMLREPYASTFAELFRNRASTKGGV